MGKDTGRYSALRFVFRVAFHPAMPVIILMLVLCLAGCATPATMVPSQLLTCAPQPAAPTAGPQRDVAHYIVDAVAAGDDCRVKLGSVRNILEPAK